MNGNTMKLTLKRTLPIQQFDAFAVLDVSEEREDIRQYLDKIRNRKSQKTAEGERRILTMLRNEGLLDNSDHITKKGEDVIETGLWKIREQGVYRFWSIVNDPLIGSSSLAVQRLQPERERGQNIVPIPLEKIITDTPVDIILFRKNMKKWEALSESVTVIDHKQNRGSNSMGIHGHYKHEPVSLCWQWNELNDSTFSISGWINSNNNLPPQIFSKENRMLPIALSLEEMWLELIREINQKENTNWQWDPEKQRLKVKLLEKNFPKESYQRFLFDSISQKSVQTAKGSFSLEGEAIPIMPCDRDEAHRWRNWLLMEKAKEGFVHPEQFKQEQREILDHPAMSSFQLPEIPADELLRQQKESKRSEPYWNVAAAFDLNPAELYELPHESFDFRGDETVTIQNFADKLRGSLDVEHIIYADRYVKESRHKKIFELLIKAITAGKTAKVDLVTWSDQIFRDQPTAINVTEIRKRKDIEKKNTHDRYMILKANEKQPVIWKFTASLDFIDCSSPELLTELDPVSVTNTSFVKMKREGLPKHLTDFL